MVAGSRRSWLEYPVEGFELRHLGLILVRDRQLRPLHQDLAGRRVRRQQQQLRGRGWTCRRGAVDRHQWIGQERLHLVLPHQKIARRHARRVAGGSTGAQAHDCVWPGEPRGGRGRGGEGIQIVVAVPQGDRIGMHAIREALRQERRLRTQIGAVVGLDRHREQSGQPDQSQTEQQQGDQHFQQGESAAERAWHGRPHEQVPAAGDPVVLTLDFTSPEPLMVMRWESVALPSGRLTLMSNEVAPLRVPSCLKTMAESAPPPVDLAHTEYPVPTALPVPTLVAKLPSKFESAKTFQPPLQVALPEALTTSVDVPRRAASARARLIAWIRPLLICVTLLRTCISRKLGNAIESRIAATITVTNNSTRLKPRLGTRGALRMCSPHKCRRSGAASLARRCPSVQRPRGAR